MSATAFLAMLPPRIPRLLALLALPILIGCRPQPPAVTSYRFAYEGIMGTYASFTFYEEEGRSQAAAEAVMAVFEEVNERFSTYRPDSELSRLNASAHEAPFACSPEMWELLTQARHAYRLSHGAFDISAGPLMKLWGFYRTRDAVPAADEIKAVMESVGLDKVVFDEASRSVRFTRPGMMLDSGGIAKGLALDLAAAKLAEMGIKRGLIDLGGNIYCLGEPPPGRDRYLVGVRNPRQTKAQIGTAPMLGQAIATSGDYERYVILDGQRFSHIMDPRTGYPVAGMASVTVIAPTGIASDYLSTTIFVNRGQYLDELVAAVPGLAVLLVSVDEQGAFRLQRHGDLWHDVKEPATW